MGQMIAGYPAWAWAVAFAFLAGGIGQGVYSGFRSGGRRRRDQAIAALCTQRGMLRLDGTRPPFRPQMLSLGQPTFRNAFATPDFALGFLDIDDKADLYSALTFSVDGLNVPYIAVTRNHQIDTALGAPGQPVQFESIDFGERFSVRAEDRRSAVMLIDQGMMQWLLDCDRVSFQVAGPIVFAAVKRPGPNSTAATELERLLDFHDHFASHVPEIVRSEYPAPAGQAAALSQAMNMASGLLS